MQVQIAIGENHRFELREALLVYYGNQTTFITKHEVTTQQNAAPTLGPAQPLTVAFVESLVRSLGGGTAAEVFPENILAKSDRMIAWWTPTQRRQMFYQNSEGKASNLNGRIFPQPPLVWRVADGQLKIRALTENKRPVAKTKLAVAPYWNLSHRLHGIDAAARKRICPGHFRLGAGFLRECLYPCQCRSSYAPQRWLRWPLERPERQAAIVPSGDPDPPS
jgi:PRTRC genetic system protein B